MNLTAPHLLLASASPRRSDILEQMGVNFSVLAVDIDESRHSDESPVDYVSRLAREKAQAGFRRQDGQLPSLGADTIVVFDGQIFGKPRGSRAGRDNADDTVWQGAQCFYCGGYR